MAANEVIKRDEYTSDGVTKITERFRDGSFQVTVINEYGKTVDLYDKNGIGQSYTRYDAKGKVIQSQEWNGKQRIDKDAEGKMRIIETEYDSEHREIKATIKEFNAKGELLSVYVNDGRKNMAFLYDGHGKLQTAFDYNKRQPDYKPVKRTGLRARISALLVKHPMRLRGKDLRN